MFLTALHLRHEDPDLVVGVHGRRIDFRVADGGGLEARRLYDMSVGPSHALGIGEIAMLCSFDHGLSSSNECGRRQKDSMIRRGISPSPD
ncbi:hypothetical protein D3C77_671940 [compost metagenome]